jgi:hypothetical protein
MPDKTPPSIAAGGKRIVASLKERIIHGHGGKNDPNLSFRGWRRVKT